jgi:hypothetical protein
LPAYTWVSVFFFFAGVSTAWAQNYAFGQSNLAAGAQPTSMATGDFNGDGKLDLVVANLGANTVSVFLGKPDGTFGPKVDYPTGLQPFAVATGDFNGDGNLDIVVTNEDCTPIPHISSFQCGPGSVSILLGNGDGTFQPQVEYATGTAPISVTVSDLNGDHNLDLVVVNNQDKTISILLGNGDGTFQAHVDYATPTGPTVVIVADFNNDGKPDVAAGSAAGVSVWLGNGDGTLQNRVDFQLRNQDAAISLAAADFNGDGNRDLAVSGASTGTSIFMGNGDGTLTFQSIAYSSGGGAIIAADFNKDGKSDLGVVDTFALNPVLNSVTILLGNGDGTFQAPSSYAVGAYPAAIVAGDFNGDSQPDLAIANANCPVEIGLNFAFTSCTAGSVTVLLGESQGLFGGTPVGASAAGIAPVFLLPVDLNGDGKPDVVVVNQGDDTVSVLLGNGDGTFKPQATYQTGHFPVSVQAGDFNSDGKMDLAVVDQVCATTANSCSAGAVSILLGKGDGTFLPRTDFTVGLTPDTVVVGDFNGDGKLDLAVGNNGLQLGNTVSVLLGNGDGTFRTPVNYTVAGAPLSMVVGDFTKDGKLDLAVNTPELPATGIGTISILLGVGDGTFKPHMDFAGGGNSVMAAGDFNNDGIPDLAVGVASGNGFSIFLSNGDGTFRAGGIGGANPLANGILDFLALGDFNADGNLDVAASADMLRLGTFRGNGDGTMQAEQDLLLSGNATLVAAADFDGDGGLDLAVYDGVVSTILNPPFKGVFPTAVAFGSQGVATTSAVQTVTLSDPSGAPFSVTNIAVSGAYTQSNNCITKLLPGQNCTINVTFAPAALGASNGTLTLTDTTHASPQVIPLTGTGVNGPFLQLSPARMTFPSTAVGTTSASQSVMLTNMGNAALTITNIAVAGGNAGDFAESNTCGGSLAPGGACSVSVTFTPTAGGVRVAALTITDSAPGSPQMVNLSGISLGSQVMLSPASLTFATRATGTTSASQSVTLTNSGGAPLSVTTIATSGDFTQTNNCGTSVAAGGACQISVTFTPTAGGSRTGSVTITDNAPGSPQTVMLTGTGEDFSMAASGTPSATVTPGQTATYTLSLAASGGFSGNVALTCTGAPTAATCSISPSTVALSGTSAVTATVTVTTTAASQMLPPVGTDTPRRINYPLAPLVLSLLAALVAAYLYVSRRNIRFRWGPALTLGLLLCAGVTLTSCGGSSGGSGGVGGGGGTGTQAGTYTITVSASATSGSTTLTHAAKLTLVVQ